MSFSERMTQYVCALAGDENAARALPHISHVPIKGARGAEKFHTLDRTLEFRAAVMEQSREIKKAIANRRSVGILEAEIKALLRMLGEMDDDDD